ncbi:primase-helicase family protein [Dechloromonas sp. A34]|uniref:primase-helicase family protein n=1 Tax=Dechloromonas sp. A34 TaxID=447588 RepID=UPI0022492BA6|nr:primase-helicase family protein [Dechloromonas sp. A34]
MAATFDETTKQQFVLKVAAAGDANALMAISAEINAKLLEAPKTRSEIFAEINDYLGLIRINGRAAFLIKDRKEWLNNSLVEVWSPVRDAEEYLLRNGVTIFEEGVTQDGKPTRINCFKLWRASPEADYFAGVTFQPEGPKRYRERFNLWNGWGTSPTAGDNHHLFLAMLRDGFCGGNAEYYEYVLSWLAHLVQKPAERPGTAIAIVSHQGAGKGTFIEILTAMIGEHNCSGDISNKDLTGGFNSKIANKLLINLNEATFSGNHEQVEFTKKLITDPTFRCEYKGLESFDAPNYSRLVITTNNVRWGRLDADDRRYLILEPAKDFPASPEFFGDLREAMFKQGGVENLFHFLKQRDISGWKASQLPARTTGFDTLEDSMTSRSELKFFYELAGIGMVESHMLVAMRRERVGVLGEPDDNLYIKCGSSVSFANLYEAYLVFCVGNRRMEPVAKNKFSMFITALGGRSVKKGNHTTVYLPGRDVLRTAVANVLGKWKLDWNIRFNESVELLDESPEPTDMADAQHEVRKLKLIDRMKVSG